ncbi:MAG: hypothetical protein GX600_09860, partial [Dehalococcoidia bacterium]|nr:hypothetical protein [Dehalococcoidia bacterium]
MFVLIFITIIVLAVSALAVLGLIGFVIRASFDFLCYTAEVVAYTVQCTLKVLVKGALAVIETVDDW